MPFQLPAEPQAREDLKDSLEQLEDLAAWPLVQAWFQEHQRLAMAELLNPNRTNDQLRFHQGEVKGLMKIWDAVESIKAMLQQEPTS